MHISIISETYLSRLLRVFRISSLFFEAITSYIKYKVTKNVYIFIVVLRTHKAIMMEIRNENTTSERKKVQGDFSQEFYMGRVELASFLRNLADQVEAQGPLRITTEEWVLPFLPMDVVKVDLDLDDTELEIEIEFKRKRGNLKAEKI